MHGLHDGLVLLAYLTLNTADRQHFGNLLLLLLLLLHMPLLMQIALALQHMHSKNMVHMDIKPDNIYIVNEVTYKLGDLGLAASNSAHQCGNFEEGDAR